jgi:hypothetical protein
MRRRVAVFAGGIASLMLVIVPAAHATTPMIKIRTATVPGGKGSKIDIVVNHACDEASGVKTIVVAVHESIAQRREIERYGDTKGRATVPATCDGTAHLVHVLVPCEDNAKQWHSYMYDEVAAALVDDYDHGIVYDNQPHEWVGAS